MAHPSFHLPGKAETYQAPGTLFQQAEAASTNMRALVGWFSEQEAMQLLLGRVLGTLDDVAQVQQSFLIYKQAVASRPTFRTSNPISEFPETEIVQAITGREDIQATFAGLEWRPARVNLEKVLSYQQVINTDGLEDRIASVRTSVAALLDLCLPVEPTLTASSVAFDPDQHGVTISSLNPNLRLHPGFKVDPVQVSVAPGVAPRSMLQVSFLVEANRSYLQVAHFRNRYFLRDGYHRAAALLRAGISIVPCILIEARTIGELGLQPGLFTPEIIFSDHPPRLTDFWDDAVSCDVAQPTMRKVIRAQTSEFALPR